MYKTIAGTRAFFAAFAPLIAEANYCDIVVAPPFVSVAAAVESARSTKISIAGQNVYWVKEGAFTGEISPAMLLEAGCRYVIVPGILNGGRYSARRMRWMAKKN